MIALFLFPLLLVPDAVLPVPGNLTAEGIPAISTDLMERAGRYTEARAASLEDWHPTRREILILTRFGNVPQVHRVAMPGGARTQTTFYPDRITAARYRPRTGDSILFSKDTGGSEFYQLYLQDLKSGEVTQLTDGKSRNDGEIWSNDGRSIAHSSTRRNGRDADIYVVQPPDPKTARLLLQVDGGGWSPEDWSPDDRKLLVSQYISVNESRLFLVDAATGAKEQLTPENPKASYSHPLFSKDGKGLYLTTDREGEFHRLAYMDLASRNLTFLRPSLNWDVSGLALSPDGRRLAYLVNEDAAETLHVLDTQTRRDIPIPSLPLGIITTLRWHGNGRDLGFTLSSAKSPADAYSIDVEKRTLDRWTRGETGGLDPEAFVEPERIRWKSFDGLSVSGLLYRPPAKFTGRRPVIVNIHGGPEGQSLASFLGRQNYYLNELGIALIYPNVRGSTGYGKTFQNLDNGMKREDSVKDIGALLDWIAARADLDPGRVLVTGGSYGGYMTLAAMVHFNDRIRCAVDVVGVSNFVTFLERTEAYRRDLRRVEYGDERDPKMRDYLLTIAPANQAAKITKPMMIVAGKNDPRVPVTESQQMAAAVRKSNAPVWYLEAADEGHGFAKKANQDFQFAATILFARRYLLE